MNLPVILIVDDEKDTCRILSKFLLKRLVCRVEEASNGEEAIDKLKKCSYDLMVLDIRMPKKNGIDVLDQLPTEQNGLEVLVITAWDSQLVAQECASRGVECLPKPFKLDEVYEKIVRILKGKDMYNPKVPRD